MSKLRVETEGPGEGVFITRNGEVIRQPMTSLVLSLSNEGRHVTFGHPFHDPLSGADSEVQASYPIGKATIIIEYEEAK